MANLNLFFSLIGSSDQNPSNNPSLGNFKWGRGISGLQVDNPLSAEYTVLAGQTVTLLTSASKKFIYMESDQTVNLTINSSPTNSIVPFIINNSTQPGVFFMSSPVNQLSVHNPGTDNATVLLIAVE